jgi:deoxyribonuclease-4
MKTTEQYSIVTSLKWEVGAHTKFSKNIYDTLKKSISYSMNVTQFFLGNPKSFTRHRASQQDIEKSKKILDIYPMHVFSHFPYVANFVGSIKQLAWDGDETQDIKTSLILSELEYELGVISLLGKTNGVVIHPGNYPDRKKGLSKIAESINKINFPLNSTLLLENAAGKGNSLCTTFQEIKDIYDQILPNKQKHIGVCVDTAHITGVGDYDLSKCSEVTRMFKEFDSIIGIDKFSLLHLNDSLIPLGGKDDRHALLGTGYVWAHNFDSLILLLNTCKEHNIPIMLETHGLDMLTLGSLSDSNTTLL